MIDAILQAAQSPDLTRRTGDLVQYLTAIGVVACVGMLWRFGGRLSVIETVLSHPELGVTPSILSLRKSRHADAGKIQEHETRLDNHDRDIERIDRALEKEPDGNRHFTADGAPYDRRSPK